MPSADQRRSPRKELTVQFGGKDAQGLGELLFEGEDLSRGGSFLKSDLLLEADELLSLQFRIPGGLRLFKVQARVVWVRRFPGPGEVGGMGVAFVGMSLEDRSLLDAYLQLP